jgi:hypothetical protein
MGAVIAAFIISLITVNVYRMIWKYSDVKTNNSDLPPEYESPPNYEEIYESIHGN